MRTLHIDEMLNSVGFLLMGRNCSVAVASTAVTSSDLCIVGERGRRGSVLSFCCYFVSFK